MAESNIYKGADNEIQPALFFRYKNGALEIQANDSLDISYAIYQSEQVSLGLKGVLFLNRGPCGA